jgi:sigma-B regulation protein RsbU (phosphoserine phosphatase)
MSLENHYKNALTASTGLMRNTGFTCALIVYKNGEEYIEVSHSYADGIEPATFSSFNENPEFISSAGSSEISLTADAGYFFIQSLSETNPSENLFVLRADGPPSEYYLTSARSLKEMICVITEMQAIVESSDSDKYKKELVNVRNMQARMFPKFDNIPGLEIGSVYLPVSLMSGNFIDAVFLDTDLYQITICDVTGYDAGASYAGAVIRTIVRSFSSKQVVPSALIQIIEKRISKIITGVNSLIYITVCQINLKTGKALISSFGPLYTVFYRHQKKGHMLLGKTDAGKDLAKRVMYKDISLSLDEGDILLFYSKGLIEAADQEGKISFGEERLLSGFLADRESSSVEIVLSITNNMYEFTNFSQLNNDVMLLCVRRKISD